MAAGLLGGDVPADLALAPHADRADGHVDDVCGREADLGPGDSGSPPSFRVIDRLLADSQRPGLVPEGELAQDQGHRQGHDQHRHDGEHEQPAGRQQEPALSLQRHRRRCP